MSKIKSGILSLFMLLIPCFAFANWQKLTYTNGDFTLPYQLFSPDVKDNEKLPLIIHLHGTGEAGTDNEAQMYKGTNYGPQYFASDENQALQKAYVVAPQTTAPIRWASTSISDYDFKTTPSTVSMTALLNLIDEMIAQNKNIDANRIYITGLSRGGQGVWNAVLQRPELFAAALAIAGSADPTEAKTISTIPIWVFAGDNDQVTNVKYSREMVDAMIRNGGSTSNVRYTEIEGGDHDSSWITAYSNSDVYRWLIKHSKNK